MKTPKDYIPIRGLGTGRGSIQVATRHRLYQASDHLMLVQSTGFTEDYRRIYYRDIESVIVRPSHRRGATTLVLVLITFILFLLPLAHVNWIAAAVCAIPFLVGIVINLLKGPSCQCHVNTRVQSLALPTPQRFSKVPILIQLLREKTAAEAVAPASS